MLKLRFRQPENPLKRVCNKLHTLRLLIISQYATCQQILVVEIIQDTLLIECKIGEFRRQWLKIPLKMGKNRLQEMELFPIMIVQTM